MDNFGGNSGALDAAINDKKAEYITTIPITLDLWDEIKVSYRIPVTGPAKELLIHHLGEPNEFIGHKTRGDAWVVDFELFASTHKISVYIGPDETREKWGISIPPWDVHEMRRRNLLLCGVDLTIWCCQENGEPKLLAQSEFWSRDRLMVLVGQLAPSFPADHAPAPPSLDDSLSPQMSTTSPYFHPEQGGEDGDE